MTVEFKSYLTVTLNKKKSVITLLTARQLYTNQWMETRFIIQNTNGYSFVIDNLEPKIIWIN